MSNESEQEAFTTAIHESLKEGAKTPEEIKQMIEDKHNEVYPVELIAECLKEELSFRAIVDIEEDDTQLIWKNSVDNGFYPSKFHKVKGTGS